MASPVATSVTFEDIYNNQIVSRRKSHRSRRMKDYDSDTGYRSDRSFRRGAAEDTSRGANSDVLSVRSQPLPHNHRSHRRRKKDANGDYASDIESYSATMFGTANEAAEAFQKKYYNTHLPSQLEDHQKQQYRLSFNSAKNMPFHLNEPATSSPNTPRIDRNFRPNSPSKSEPRQPGSRRHTSEYNSNPRVGNNSLSSTVTVFDGNSSLSNDSRRNSHDSISHTQFDNLTDKVDCDDFYSVNDSANGRKPQQNLHVRRNSYSKNQSYLQTDSHDLSNHKQDLSKPPVAPKPPKPQQLGNFNGSNTSLRSSQTPSPSTPVFQKDNFVDHSTPLVSQPSEQLAGAINQSMTSGRERTSLYTVIEERGGSHRNLVSLFILMYIKILIGI